MFFYSFSPIGFTSSCIWVYWDIGGKFCWIFREFRMKFLSKKISMSYTESPYINWNFPSLHTYTYEYTHIRWGGASISIHIWWWCGHNEKISESLQKAFRLQAKYPTSSKPILDRSPIWHSPVLLYSNKLVHGFLSQLLLLLFMIHWSLATVQRIMCNRFRRSLPRAVCTWSDVTHEEARTHRKCKGRTRKN